jgi:hypothetical protein
MKKPDGWKIVRLFFPAPDEDLSVFFNAGNSIRDLAKLLRATPQS